MTARWREEHLLAPAEMALDGELIDLTDPGVRADLEQRHASFLIEYGLAHLGLHEVTSRRRIVTQTIAADLFDRCNAGALRFPSRLDGQPALVVFEGRGELVEAGDPIELTDPAPEMLLAVCREWGLELEPSEDRWPIALTSIHRSHPALNQE